MTVSNALSYRNRLRLAKQMVWRSIAYAIAAWADASLTDLIKLRGSYSRAAKCMLYLPWLHSTNVLFSVLYRRLMEEFITTAVDNECLDQHSSNLLPLADAITDAWFH